MIKMKFNRKYVPLVGPFVAKHDIRYYLGGLRIEAAVDRPGVYIIGCDGHRLTIAYDADGTLEGDDGKGVIMRLPPQFIAACKAKAPVPLQVIAKDKRVSVCPDFDSEHDRNEMYVMPGNPWIEGSYPKWRQILPKWESLKPGFVGSVQVGYLTDYASLGKSDGVVFWQEQRDKPIVVQHLRHSELVSILMPRRIDSFEERQALQRLSEFVATQEKEAA